MPAITAKPITATPITARPLTAYGLGESTEGANPLVWHALAANSSGVITDQIKGAGTPTWAHTSSLLLPDYQGVYRTIGSGEAPIVGARWVDGVPYATDELGDPLTDWWFQCQPSYTNSATYSNDLTNAVWTASNVTVAKDAVGLDGAPNTACTLTATAGNGTVIRDAITAASGGHTTQWHIKRKTGTGNIEITIDNGSTWQDVTSLIDASAFNECLEGLTVTNPQIGIRIVTSGDAVYVGNSACHLSKTEAQCRGSAPILTAASTVSTTAVYGTFDIANHSDTKGAYYVNMSFQQTPTELGTVLAGNKGIIGIGAYFTAYGPFYAAATPGRFQGYDGTNVPLITGQTWSVGDSVKGGSVFGGSSSALVFKGSAGAAASYDGAWNANPQDNIVVGEAAGGVIKIRDLRRYNLSYDAGLAKLLEITA